MYKTIRHGENSLQYTILPQNDDFRIEGKLTSAEGSRTSGKSHKSKSKHPRRRSFFAYLGLIFVCSVIVGAILIPFLVSAECLPSPTEWFLKTKTAFSKSSNVETKYNENGRNNSNNSTKDLVGGNGINVGKIIKFINKDGTTKAVFSTNQTNEPTAVFNTTTAASSLTNLKINSSNINNLQQQPIENELKTQTGNAIATDVEASIATVANTGVDVENVVNFPQKDSNTQLDANEKNNYVTEVRFDSMQENYADELTAIVPTIVITTSVRNTPVPNKTNAFFSETLPVAHPTSSQSANAIYSPRLPASNIGPNLQPVAQAAVLPTIMTRIIQVPLLKSAAKKPIIPPVLAKTNSQHTNVVNNWDNTIKVTDYDGQNHSLASSSAIGPKSFTSTSTKSIQGATNSNWIRWSYLDPSNYLQWTGYKAEDSVLLPALLGFALIGMILIITVCLVARNKRTIVSSVRKRNRNDLEETGAEDNTTLLTTANLSDED